MSRIRAILFDKDGTIIDFERTWGPAVKLVVQELAHGDSEIYSRLCAASGLQDGHFVQESPLIGEPTYAFAAIWAQILGLQADQAFFARVDGMLCAATTANLVPIDQPAAILRELIGRGYHLGLLTNDAVSTACTHARKLGIEGMLRFVAGYDSGFGAKPSAGPVLAFAERVGVSAREVLLVGDTGIDVATARAAGARAILLLSGPTSRVDLSDVSPDAVLNSIADLPRWLTTQEAYSTI